MTLNVKEKKVKDEKIYLIFENNEMKFKLIRNLIVVIY